jgi:hypothetical protein
MWAVTEDGDASLTFNDGRGKSRLAFSVDSQGNTNIEMTTRDGRPQASWAATDNGENEIAFFDNMGTGRLGIKVSQNASAILLNDSDGNTRTIWSVVDVGPANKAELGFYDTQANRRLAMMSVSDGTPVVLFPDEANPSAAFGGWYVRDKNVTAISKGSLPGALVR